MHHWIDNIVNWITVIFYPPTLVYHVTFDQPWPNVDVNDVGLGGTFWIAAGQQSTAPSPGAGQLPQQPGGGLRLQVTRQTADTGIAGVMCAPNANFPLSRFRMTARYRLGDGPMGASDIWAPTLIVRDGGQSDMRRPDGTPARVVGATHQVRDSGQIALGAGSAATAITPAPKNNEVSFTNAYPTPMERGFTLETDIFCDVGRGRSRLRTALCTLWAEARWDHPFKIDPADPAHWTGITYVGVGCAIAQGAGTATVTVDEFSIYKWTKPMPAWLRAINRV